MKRIYLDNAATTACAPEVVEAMLPYFTQTFGNASSVHAFGRESRRAIETARRQVARALNAAAPQNVNNRDGLDIFEAVRQWYEDLCHNDQMRFFASLQRILRPIMSLSLSAATAFSASSRTGIWTNP